MTCFPGNVKSRKSGMVAASGQLTYKSIEVVACQADFGRSVYLVTRSENEDDMRAAILGLTVGGLVGAGIGFAVGLFVYPYIFLADIVAMEEVQDAASKEVVAKGNFIHANPSDPIHYGKGSVTVYKDVLHLEKDFEVGPGPKFHVYLVPKSSVTPDDDVAASMYVDLGRLRAFKGSQVFPVPAGVDLADYPSVVVWCERFGVLISPASLEYL